MVESTTHNKCCLLLLLYTQCADHLTYGEEECVAQICRSVPHTAHSLLVIDVVTPANEVGHLT